MNDNDQEHKFVGDTTRAAFAEAWLSHSCLRDREFPAGLISSIYYDTPALDLYEQKADGDFLKIKCRLRWYDPDVSANPAKTTVFMETKRRFGERRRKARRRFELERAWLKTAELDDPLFPEFLREEALRLEEELPAGLAAAALISYNRRRFHCPFSGARVSLDTAIELSRTNPRLIPAAGRVILRHAVVEIKGAAPERIPWVCKLYDAGFRQRSFSKYGECLELLREGR